MILRTKQVKYPITEADFKYYQVLVDSQQTLKGEANSLTENRIPCCMIASERCICIEVEGYEENMIVCFEYYQGRLQVHVWGEKSLKNGGDIDTTVIITDDYPRFCQKIESSYF